MEDIGGKKAEKKSKAKGTKTKSKKTLLAPSKPPTIPGLDI
jgi:hypothetical protein